MPKPIPRTTATRRPVPVDKLSRSAARARFGLGVISCASNKGLAALARERPHDWDKLVRQWSQGMPRGHRTVAHLVRSSLCAKALPRHNRDLERIKRYRRFGRRLAEMVGSYDIRKIREKELESLRLRLLESGLSSDEAGRTVSYLRVTLRELYQASGRPVPSLGGKGKGKRIGRKPSRPVAALKDVARLFGRLEPGLRVALALSLSGVRPGELLAVRGKDVSADGLCVKVLSRSPQGIVSTRWRVLPAWARTLVVSHIERQDRDRPLILGANGAHLAPGSLTRKFRRAADSILGKDTEVTLAAVFRLWQLIAQEGNLPAEEVRASWRCADFSGGVPVWLNAARALMDRWGLLGSPPVPISGRKLRPRSRPEERALSANSAPSVPVRTDVRADLPRNGRGAVVGSKARRTGRASAQSRRRGSEPREAVWAGVRPSREFSNSARQFIENVLPDVVTNLSRAVGVEYAEVDWSETWEGASPREHQGFELVPYQQPEGGEPPPMALEGAELWNLDSVPLEEGYGRPGVPGWSAVEPLGEGWGRVVHGGGYEVDAAAPVAMCQACLTAGRDSCGCL